MLPGLHTAIVIGLCWLVVGSAITIVIFGTHAGSGEVAGRTAAHIGRRLSDVVGTVAFLLVMVAAWPIILGAIVAGSRMMAKVEEERR